MTYTVVQPPPRRRAGWDIALSIVLLVLSFIGLFVGSIINFFFLAFTDYCPPATCHPTTGVTWLALCVGGAVLVLIVGTVATIILLRRRRRGWWVAALTAVLVGTGVVLGGLLYATAVGYA